MTLPIYFDYNATTPLDPAVIDAMLPYLREHFGNPSSSCWGDRQPYCLTSAKTSGTLPCPSTRTGASIMRVTVLGIVLLAGIGCSGKPTDQGADKAKPNSKGKATLAELRSEWVGKAYGDLEPRFGKPNQVGASAKTGAVVSVVFYNLAADGSNVRFACDPNGKITTVEKWEDKN
jgi:hypothetical protein